MILSNIKEFLGRNKKILYYISLFFIVSFLTSDITFAADTGGGLFTKEGFIEALNVIIQLIGVMLAIGTYLATLFLSPEWINGSLFGLSKHFKDIWIIVSNLVYFIFAFILIWIAFMNIIGKNADQYQLKQALPKFIVGVIIVPFSWFLVQFILSISSILTISALTLPVDTFTEYGSSMKSIKVPTECTLNLSSLDVSKKGGDTKKTDTNGQMIECKSEVIDDKEKTSIDSIYGIISLYTYGILKFDSMDDISKTFVEQTKTKAVGDIFVKVLFDVVFILVYGILIIAIALVLLIRGIYIWIYMMLSPIFGLMYFFDKKDGGGDGFFSKFNLKEFIALAMVPVYTMLALSFGLLFIFIVGTGLSKDSGSQEIKVDNSKLTLGKYSLIIKGNVGSIESNDVNGFMKAIADEAGSQGALGVIGTLILKIFGIVILWGAVMAGLRSSEITKTVVEPLHQFGNQVGKIASSAPGNIPIFGGQSMKGLSQMSTTAGSYFDTKSRDRGSEFLKNHNLFQSGTTDLSNKSLNALTVLSKNNKIHKDGAIEYKKAFDSGKNVLELSKNKQFIDATLDIAKKLGIDKSDIDKIKTGMSQSDLSRILGDIDYKLKHEHSGYGIDLIGGGIDKKGTVTASEINGYKESGEITSVKQKNDIKLDIRESTLERFRKKGENESSDFNDKDIKDLATIIHSKVRPGNITREELRTKIISDLDIVDKGVQDKILEAIKTVNSEMNIKTNFYIEEEKK